MQSSNRIRALVRAHRRLFVGALVALSLMLWAVVGVSAWFVRDIVTGLPQREALRSVGTMAQSTTLYDTRGRAAFAIFREQRIEVPLSRVSSHLVRAILSVEDQRFYDHGGVDVVRVLGAAMTNVRERRAAQGGSTITQQLARQSFLSSDKTLQRKLKEIVVALRLERAFSKNDILELYLNKVYFGDGLYGVEAASLGYFGKHASELDVAEAALLAGLVKSPSTYAPTRNPERALGRRNVVLQAMLSSRAIDRRAYDRALRTQVVLRDALRREESYGRYFKEDVRKELVQRFGWDRVYDGGLKVYTTLDLDLQKVAEAEVQRALAALERRGRRDAHSAEPLQAALVALDPKTGEVRAMVGGRDFDASRFNRAMQARRQPGSAFKPFVYAAALERGYTPATLITGLDRPIMTLEGEWVPEDEHFSGNAVTVRTALRTSSNRAAVRMLEQVGIPETVRYAERLGVGSVPNVPSLALGSGEVTLLSMTAAFAAFANEGMLSPPSLIRRVETMSGEVLYESTRRSARVVSEATAFIMSTMLADVINAGTGWQARRVGFTLPAAGKTGTTNDYHDAWFVGYTPRLVTGVWLGYDQPRPIRDNGYAGDIAVPLWGRFMKAATEGHDPEWFRAPKTVGSVNICRISGKLPVDGCRDAVVTASDGTVTRRSTVYTEYFVRGTEPFETCQVHGGSGFFTTLLGTSGQGEPVPAPAPPPSDAPAASSPAQAEEPKKKRSFWSRVFGFGKDDDEKEDEEEKQNPPRPPRKPPQP